MELKVIVRLFNNNERCFGPGVADLLERVREQNSLRAAAQSMHMAYSKAWRIVRGAEAAFGCKLLTSTIGGPHGGGAVLTADAEKILDTYRSMEADLDERAQAEFRKKFASYLS